MLHHDIHEKLLAYTDRELELLRANYQLCHKFKSHMERRFFKDNYIHIEKQTRFTKIPLHSHGFIELIYIYQGKMHQKINEESLTLGKGEILLINQFARHEIEAAGQNDIIINFIIKTEFFGRLMSLLTKITSFPVLSFQQLMAEKNMESIFTLKWGKSTQFKTLCMSSLARSTVITT